MVKIMVIYWLFFILIISFFSRNYKSSDKLKLWILIVIAIYIIKKNMNLEYFNNDIKNMANINKLSDNVDLSNNSSSDNKFNNFVNKLFIVGNRNTGAQTKTNNKNISS